MKPVELNKNYEIEILSLGSNAEGVGRIENFTIFVENALPNEKIFAKIIEVKKNYAVGKLIKILRESSDRVKPFCPIYFECGGCQLQHLNYSAQLKLKKKIISDALERIGKIDGVEILETIGMENPLRYRNKMQFPVGKNKSEIIVGCFAKNSHKIIDTDSCMIQREGNDKILRAVKKIANKLKISAYDEDKHTGILRHVMGRVGLNNELMAVLVTAKKNLPDEKKIIRAIREELPEISSIQQNIQTYKNNVILGRETKILYGRETIKDKIGNLKFNISARSFFQVNTEQAEILYKTALNFAELSGREIVIDAYCGTGTISLFLAKSAYKVYGIEIVNSAINDAKKNARENKIRNAEFICGDAVKVIPKLFSEGIFADVVIVDPPRAGCEKKVLETFASMNPAKIIYVSCNPATLARDLKILSELGYKTKKIQPVDMFPFSSHVESVAQIVKETD
ncbi:MAG: 23S rRNA (uracil(1939)-C(5))-methyltransferase RlmD [Selenomonadaceae bacterium]|nr:23S rRNA (uracil(1939)-C(5))-methyltransferase RlmD [Selenomonadaceae bacterium]